MQLDYILIILGFFYPGFLLCRLKSRRSELIAPHILISLAFFGWMLPQAMSILNDKLLLENFYYEFVVVLITANLILLSTHYAWICAHKAIGYSQSYSFEHQLKIARVMVVLCTIVGLTFRVLIYDQNVEVRGNAMWSGTITILFLFSKVQYLAFAVAIWGYIP